MNDSVEAFHILIMYEGSQGSNSSRSKEEALERIKVVAAELAEGEDFKDLASEYSECPSSRDGGSLGEFKRGEMVPEFDAVAFDLKVGDTSSVVETSFGFHLIQRTG